MKYGSKRERQGGDSGMTGIGSLMASPGLASVDAGSLAAAVDDLATALAGDVDDSAAFAIRVIGDAAMRHARKSWQVPGMWQGRDGARVEVPFKVWHGVERRYRALDGWAQLLRQAPPGAGDHSARRWNWTSTMNGGRVEVPPSHISGIVDLEGASGGSVVLGRAKPRMILRSPGSYEPAAQPTDPARHAGVRIAFPEWATLSRCEEESDGSN